MLGEHFDQDPPASNDPELRQGGDPEFVGAPTEYADAAEVPESFSLIAKILAGGVLSWTALTAAVILLGISCAICALLSFALGVALR